MIKITHACISENGTVNGVKGDQTGKEVCTRNYYDLGTGTIILRANDYHYGKVIAETAKELAKNENIGYSQATRNTARDYWLEHGKIDKPVNTDCSAFVTLVLLMSGIRGLDPNGNSPTTRNLCNKLVTLGFHIVTDGTVEIGDIHVKPNKHTFIITDTDTEHTPIYKIGCVYTLKSEMHVRVEPSIRASLVKYVALTENAKLHDADKDGNLDKGTRITVKAVKDIENRIWVKCPSGWICAYNKVTRRIYVS